MKCKKNFTLVELLVTVAIMAILLSLVLQAIGKAKARGRQAQCLNNFKQNGLAIFSYCDDSSSCFPPSVIQTGSIFYSWVQIVSPYCTNIKSFADSTSFVPYPYSIKSPMIRYWKVFICPETQNIWGEENAGVGIFVCKSTSNLDVMPSQSASYNTGKLKKINFMSAPSQTGLVWDGKAGDYESVSTGFYSGILWSGGTPDYRHNKTISILYADGHVASKAFSLILPIAYGANGDNNNLWR